MSHTIELPEEIYKAIERYAAERGETPEALIIAWADTIKEQSAQSAAPDDGIDDPARDPWAGLRGATTMLSPDSIEHHDTYLAEEYTNRHESEQ